LKENHESEKESAMANKPTRRGWLKGLLGAIFGLGAAGAARGQVPEASGPPAPLPIPPAFACDFGSPLIRVTTVVYDANKPLLPVSPDCVTTYVYDPGGHGEVGRA
jgi:hypothetical protein